MFQCKSTPASSVGSDDWRSSKPKFDYLPKKKAALKLNLMRQDPKIKVLSGIKVIEGRDSRGYKQYYFRVKVFRYHYTRTKVNAAQIVADDAVRVLENYGKSSPKNQAYPYLLVEVVTLGLETLEIIYLEIVMEIEVVELQKRNL